MAIDNPPPVNPIYPKELVKAPKPVPGVRLIENVYVTMRDGIDLRRTSFSPSRKADTLPCSRPRRT